MSYSIKIEFIKIFKETYLAVCLIFKGIGMLSMINKNIFITYSDPFPIRLVLDYVTLRKAISKASRLGLVVELPSTIPFRSMVNMRSRFVFNGTAMKMLKVLPSRMWSRLCWTVSV